MLGLERKLFVSCMGLYVGVVSDYFVWVTDYLRSSLNVRSCWVDVGGNFSFAEILSLRASNDVKDQLHYCFFDSFCWFFLGGLSEPLFPHSTYHCW